MSGEISQLERSLERVNKRLDEIGKWQLKVERKVWPGGPLENTEEKLDILNEQLQRLEERLVPGEKKRKLNHSLDEQLELRRAVNGLEGLSRRWAEPLLLFVYSMKKEDGTAETISLLSTENPDELARARAGAAHVIERTSETLEALSNGNRLRMLIELFSGEKHPKELVSATGLEGGALYHHLDALTNAGLIGRTDQGRIKLTHMGGLLTHLALIIFEVRERDEKEASKKKPEKSETAKTTT